MTPFCGWLRLNRLVALLPLLGCVQTETVPLSTLPAFPVEVRLPEVAPVARQVQGRLTTVDLGQTALLEGWVSRADSQLVVVTDQPAEVLSVRRFERPAETDQAEELPPPDSAFRVILRSQAQPIKQVCVVARAVDEESVLRGSDPFWCPGAR